MDIKINQGLINSTESVDIRKTVFVEEQHFNDEFDEIDDIAYHTVIFDNGVPVATGRLYSSEDAIFHIGRVAVLKEYRGKGIGNMVVASLENKAAELGASEINLSAQVRVSEFYKRLGYRAVGKEYFDEYCPHIRMIKKI